MKKANIKLMVNSAIMSLNGIAHRPLKRTRQDDKLLIAEAKRQGKTVAEDGTISGSVDSTKNYYRTLNELDYSQLPTRYNPTSNTGNLVENPNPAGLLQGRPFSSSGVTLSQLMVSYDATYATSSGNITDQTNNNYTGVLVGATHDTVNDYFTFDGVNDYIRTPDLYNTAVANPDTFSVGVWTYPTDGGVVVSITDTTTPSTAYHFSSIEYLSLAGRPTPYFGIWNAGIQQDNGTALNYNQWYHLAQTYNGTTMKGYVNGVEVASVTSVYDSPLDSVSTNHYFLFGAADTTNMGNGSYYDGRMNEMRIYSDALTDTEVLANFNASKGRYGY